MFGNLNAYDRMWNCVDTDFNGESIDEYDIFKKIMILSRGLTPCEVAILISILFCPRWKTPIKLITDIWQSSCFDYPPVFVSVDMKKTFAHKSVEVSEFIGARLFGFLFKQLCQLRTGWAVWSFCPLIISCLIISTSKIRFFDPGKWNNPISCWDKVILLYGSFHTKPITFWSSNMTLYEIWYT